MYYVKLTYFKGNGKFYASGSYVSELEHLFEIWAEVRDKQINGELPGLVSGAGMPLVLVKVPQHPHNHPHLVVELDIET